MSIAGGIKQSFEFELKQFSDAVDNLESSPNEQQLKVVCQHSRALYSATEEWVLLEPELPPEARRRAVAAHQRAGTTIAKITVPSHLAYIPESISTRTQKLAEMDRKSVKEELMQYLQ